MPLQLTNGGKLLMPVETEADVHAVFEKALPLSQTSDFLTTIRYQADIEDHFYYIGADAQNDGRGELLLLPYDDRLVYCNGHTERTEGVHGDVGGPPLGLNENPCCPICQKLMFHVCTIANTLREYGDGFRSLFFL